MRPVAYDELAREGWQVFWVCYARMSMISRSISPAVRATSMPFSATSYNTSATVLWASLMARSALYSGSTPETGAVISASENQTFHVPVYSTKAGCRIVVAVT